MWIDSQKIDCEIASSATAHRNTLAGTRDKKIGGLVGIVCHHDLLAN